jgi:hypothetical protein
MRVFVAIVFLISFKGDQIDLRLRAPGTELKLNATANEVPTSNRIIGKYIKSGGKVNVDNKDGTGIEMVGVESKNDVNLTNGKDVSK